MSEVSRSASSPAAGAWRAPEQPLSRVVRIQLVTLGLGLIAMWGVARWLEPSPSGLGTHQQLGLPPCTFRMLFGMRCPSCGMTTSWAHLARGDVVSAVRANTGGVLLGLMSLAVVPWLFWHGWRGTKGRLWIQDWVALVVALGLVGVTLVDWCWRL